jgi:hypothetical protein
MPKAVALFEIDDVGDAETELTASGIKIVGSIESDQEWTWLHFRGPPTGTCTP